MLIAHKQHKAKYIWEIKYNVRIESCHIQQHKMNLLSSCYTKEGSGQNLVTNAFHNFAVSVCLICEEANL